MLPSAVNIDIVGCMVVAPVLKTSCTLSWLFATTAAVLAICRLRSRKSLIYQNLSTNRAFER